MRLYRTRLTLCSLDDKLFSFWLLQGDSYPYSHVKGIYRFETGIKVNEFRDLRANPRCLLESQILSFRVRWSRALPTGVFGPASGRARNTNSTPSPISGATQKRAPGVNNSNNMGLPFDPYDYSPLPARILATGAAAKDRKSTRLNSSHSGESRMPSSA